MSFCSTDEGENRLQNVHDRRETLWAQMLVFDRKDPIQNVLNTCGGKLHIKKKAKGAALLEGDEVSGHSM